MKYPFNHYRVEASFRMPGNRCTGIWLQHPRGGRTSSVFKDNYDPINDDDFEWDWKQIKPEKQKLK